MKKYRILIIDDEFKTGDKSRKEPICNYFTNEWINQNPEISNKDEITKKLLIEFELLFSSTMDEFREQIEEKDIHAFFIDYVLGNYNDEIPKEIGDFEKNDFKEVLHLIKDRYSDAPIYVYSSKWNESLVYHVLEDFNDVFTNKRLPNQLLTFQNFKNAINDCRLNKTPPNWNSISKIGKARERIWDTIATAKNHVQFQPSSPSGDIVILHISDLQFGDKDTTPNDIGMWNNMEAAIQKYLIEKNLQGVDLILITGDVAMAGKKTEYKEAADEMKPFFRRLWGNDDAAWKNRIIIVPGNHDFDINACVLEYFKAENKEKERSIDFDSVIKQIEEQKDSELQDTKDVYQRLGLQAFREFAYELTHDEQYIRNENLDFIVNKFNNWGLRFICLNSVFRINAQKTNRAEISTDSIRAICNEISSGKEILTIVLVHHTLLSEEYLTEEEASNIKKALNALRSVGAKIVMGGHRHKNEKGENTNSGKKTLHTLEAASLRVETKSDEYVRGFGLLTISGTLKSAELQYFVFDKNDGEITADRAYKYEF
ncbi:MAG: hypothetical protein HDR14_08035 [Lachnospiraceae bacterium]|nr:hypothetical protein [Lachnospiraceae bacterium]